MSSAKTFTGEFSIGFRRLGAAWQKNPAALAEWTITNGFGFIDLGKLGAADDLAHLRGAGLGAGSVDLLDWEGFQVMIAPDSEARRAMIASTAEFIRGCAAAGAAIFFTVTIPANKTLSRRENFNFLVESYSALIPALDRANAKVVIEGWPGPAAVCCTPETYRAFFQAIGSPRFGVNYDPSHLLRMGIDPHRFLAEFADRVFHVHAKDTALFAEDLYQYGHEQPPTFAAGHGWGGAAWRYTIPGHGQSRWIDIFRTLQSVGYRGLVSIELEDENFNGTEAGEQRGLIQSRQFLEGC